MLRSQVKMLLAQLEKEKERGNRLERQYSPRKIATSETAKISGRRSSATATEDEEPHKLCFYSPVDGNDPIEISLSRAIAELKWPFEVEIRRVSKSQYKIDKEVRLQLHGGSLYVVDGSAHMSLDVYLRSVYHSLLEVLLPSALRKPPPLQPLLPFSAPSSPEASPALPSSSALSSLSRVVARRNPTPTPVSSSRPSKSPSGMSRSPGRVASPPPRHELTRRPKTVAEKPRSPPQREVDEEESEAVLRRLSHEVLRRERMHRGMSSSSSRG